MEERRFSTQMSNFKEKQQTQLKTDIQLGDFDSLIIRIVEKMKHIKTQVMSQCLSFQLKAKLNRLKSIELVELRCINLMQITHYGFELCLTTTYHLYQDPKENQQQFQLNFYVLTLALLQVYL